MFLGFVSITGLIAFFIIIRPLLFPSCLKVVEFIWPLLRPEFMVCFLIMLSSIARLLFEFWIMAPWWFEKFFGVSIYWCIPFVTDWFPWWRMFAFWTELGPIEPMPPGYMFPAPMNSMLFWRWRSLIERMRNIRNKRKDNLPWIFDILWRKSRIMNLHPIWLPSRTIQLYVLIGIRSITQHSFISLPNWIVTGCIVI